MWSRAWALQRVRTAVETQSLTGLLGETEDLKDLLSFPSLKGLRQGQVSLPPS